MLIYIFSNLLVPLLPLDDSKIVNISCWRVQCCGQKSSFQQQEVYEANLKTCEAEMS